MDDVREKAPWDKSLSDIQDDGYKDSLRNKPPPAPPPEIEAMQQMLSEAFHREMILRAEIVRLRRGQQREE